MEYIEKNKDRLIEDLLGCISIASLSEDKEKVEEALDYTLGVAKKMGMKASKLLDGKVGIVEIGQGTETLGILTHIDVVDEGNRKLWKCDPFKGQIKDGKIFGRGALDDKGPLYACLHAMKATMEESRPFTKKVQMIIGTQEEIEWSDMDEFVKNYPLPDYGFTPDGEYPICNIEKGGVDAVLQFPINEVRCGEKKQGLFLCKIKGGTAVNVVPGECSAVLSDGTEINISGKAVHSSRPDKGENAIIFMAKKLSSMDLQSNNLLEKVKMIERRFSDVYGRDVGIFSKSEYFNGEFIHRNVISPTMIETTENNLEVTVNIRFAYSSSEKEMVLALEKLCREEGGVLKYCSTLPAVYVSKDDPFLKKLASSYEKETNLKNEFSLAYGGSYAKTMKRIVSWGPVLPGMEDTCHEENESISIDNLITNYKIYYGAILEIAKGEESYL